MKQIASIKTLESRGNLMSEAYKKWLISLMQNIDMCIQSERVNVPSSQGEQEPSVGQILFLLIDLEGSSDGQEMS